MDQDIVGEALAKSILAIGLDSFAQTLHRWLETACSFDNFTIIAFFQDRRPQVLMTHARDRRVFERIDSHYVKAAYLLDPFFALHQSNAAEGLYRLADIAPDQFHRNEYFKSYYKNTTLTDELAFVSSPSPGVTITVCIGRDATTATKFSSRERATTRKMAPVVNALVRKNWRNLKSEGLETPDDVAGVLRLRLLEERGISLSARQSEVAFLILQGHSSLSIGLTLGISPQTVKVIRKQLYKKCEISSQGELYYLIAPYL